MKNNAKNLDENGHDILTDKEAIFKAIDLLENTQAHGHVKTNTESVVIDVLKRQLK